MFEIIKAIIYGIVEGITEWLPISSTGHLILVGEFLPFKGLSDGFFEMFDVVIQLGAIISVLFIFWWKIWPFYIKGKEGKSEVVKKDSDPTFGKIALSLDAFRMWIKIVVACVPAVIYGLILDDKVEEWMSGTIGNTNIGIKPAIVAIMLILVGVLFIIVENKNKKKQPKVESLSKITYTQAFIIGICQLIAAILPGTSRSGSTILGGISLGISRTVIAEFTFFLGIPVMFGASLLKLLKFGFHFTSLELSVLIVGMVVSFIVSLLVIRFIMGYIKKHDFKPFGVYRIILGLVVLIYFGLRALF